MLSIILQVIQVNEIGLKFFRSVLEPLLCMGTTVACCHKIGTSPSSILTVKILDNISHKLLIWPSESVDIFFKRIEGIPSIPS